MTDNREEEEEQRAQDREAARLAELQALQILDTASDERVDQLTRLAADLFDVPVALVTLVDANRQWFLSNCGLEDYSQTPRDMAFCAHALHVDEILVIPDARADPRFRDNALVTGDPHIRFYAGAVLRGPQGHALGTLCLIDYVARSFPERAQQQLIRLARVVESELLNREDRHELRERAERAAFYDEATGLPGRHLIRGRLRTVLGAEEPPRALVFAVCLESLDELRSSLSAEGVDALIAQVAGALRETLPRQCEIGRWDQDEFIAIAPGGVPGCDADSVLDGLVEAAGATFRVEGRELRLAAGIGVARAPDDGREGSVLINLARDAFRRRAGSFRGNCRICRPLDPETAARRLDVGDRLGRAIAEGHITMALQPRVDTVTGRIAGAEALARWHDPELGAVSPGEFIPVAESAGRMAEIGDAVLRRALAHLREGLAAGRRVVPISVNVSSAELHDPDFPARVRRTLAEYEVPAQLLELEVTESSLIEDVETAIAGMQALRPLGVRFAIDDFGTGYSSFRYLRELPLDVIKIDRSFVREIVRNDNDAAIVQAVTAMGRSLGLEIVAEGVEEASQLLFLRAYRSEAVQGFLFALPMPAAEFSALLAADHHYETRVRPRLATVADAAGDGVGEAIGG